MLVFNDPVSNSPIDLAVSARNHARSKGHDVLLVDTAGRLHVDEELMTELIDLQAKLQPAEILFVADAMTGQDAIRSAEEFHQKLSLTGVILTKLDGDARGGAALSIRSVTGQPIKFVGIGEKYDNLEIFHPDRMASRILGMGDMLTLIEKAGEVVSHEQAEDMQRKLRQDGFTMENFSEQIRQARKIGPLSQIISMLPSIGPFQAMKASDIDDRELVRVEAMISSMTMQEKSSPKIINGSRRKRIALGSGTSVQEVNQLLKQFDQIRKMMRGSGARGMFQRQMGKMKLPAMTAD